MITKRPRLFWLTLAVMVTAVATSHFAPKDVVSLPGGFESPVIALELARSAGDAALIMDGPERRSGFRTSVYTDFGFIFFYTLLWAIMGRRVSPIAALLAVLGGLADVIEDIGMLITLAAPAPTENAVNWTFYASHAKWLALGLVFIALFFYFRPRFGIKSGWDLTRSLAGLAYICSGVICVAGVFLWNPLIEYSVPPLSVALLLQLVLALLKAEEIEH